MFFWFLATAILTIAWVFKDPRFDYRLLAAGAVLPDLIDWPTGWRLMHSVMTSIVLLSVVMLVSVGRKPYRKLLLGVPIGTFLHLVFDGAFANTTMFWWPIGGWEFSADVLPVVARGWWNAPMELAGAVARWMWWRRRLATA
ncbi:MAG: hypothetical protein ACO31V_05365 [Ilumatobacteraceae bacterium]